MWLVIALVIFTVLRQIDQPSVGAESVPYSTFLHEVREKHIDKVELQSGPDGTNIIALTKDAKKFITVAPFGETGLIGDLINNGVAFTVVPREQPSLLLTLITSFGPILLLLGVMVYMMRQQMGGGKGGPMSFGKSKARRLDEASNTITFADVAGCDEAKEEVKEFVDFLKDPTSFQKLGGRIPRGALLVGPPGTGKTLLAKAVAGEAKVPFFTISGSDFVEMFVGVGAARVRDMFAEAKKASPSILFIDELDAVGRQRGAGLGGGNDEREQTLNQMLVEMDGFDTSVSVIVFAATNRPDILDAALLRPGRFDRQVYVTLPDVRGREQILNVHMRKVPCSPNVDPSIIARGTPGFSGADLANLVNEAALFATRRKGNVVEMVDFDKAKDKIMMGPEKKTMIMPAEELKNTAYHESGHVLVAKLLPKTDPVHKVTIIPRGRALGVTMQLPEGDRYSLDKERMLATMAILFGGRIAEEVFMNQMTTGASNDFERATAIARDMVTKYGMTEELGPMVYAENEGEVFLGRSVTKTTSMSELTMQKVDAVIRRIIDEQYAVARTLIESNQDKMHVMAKALLEWETLDADQIDDIMNDRPPRPPKDLSPPPPTTPTPGSNVPPTGETPPSGDAPAPPTIHPDSKQLARDSGMKD